MSRAFWGHAPPNPDDGRQLSLTNFVDTAAPLQQRSSTSTLPSSSSTSAAATTDSTRHLGQQQAAKAENRVAQRGKTTPGTTATIVAKESSSASSHHRPPSKSDNKDEKDRVTHSDKNRNSTLRQSTSFSSSSSSTTSLHPSGATITEFDALLLTPFFRRTPVVGSASPSCAPPPRDCLKGVVFFLNSCDNDPLISVFLLEKLLRFMGGHTSMSDGGRTNYIVAQHLCSAKDSKVASSSKKNAALRRYVHPHFILQCAHDGRHVAPAPFFTLVPRVPPLVYKRLDDIRPLSCSSTVSNRDSSSVVDHAGAASTIERKRTRIE